MGHRANLAIGNAGSYELFYSHWCANTLPRDLFWGSEHAIDFVSRQRPVAPEDGWLDTVWAEGGAVVDPENRVVLFYGGEDLLYDVPLRRLFLRMMNVAWGDWTIHWAFEGIVSIAEYLGVARRHVIAESDDTSLADLSPPKEKDWLSCIGTVRCGDNLSIYPLDGFLRHYLHAGPGLLAASKSIESYAEFNVAEWTSEFPSGGFHADMDDRRLAFWAANDCPNLVADVSDAWRDWQIDWYKDRFESHVQLTNSVLSLNERSASEMLPELLQMLGQDSKPVDLLELVEKLSEHDGSGEVKVNPFAVRDDRLAVDADFRKQVLARCVAEINDG